MEPNTPLQPGLDGMADDNGAILPAMLLVSDSEDSEVGELVANLGFRAERAPGVRSALAMLEERDLRIVLCDAVRGKLDWRQLCLEVRERKNPYVYFILLTGDPGAAERHAAYEAGVDDVLPHPLDADALAARLHVAARILKTERELQGVSHRLRMANSNLETASRRFEELFQKLPVACFTLGADGLIYEWNREAEQSFGIEAPFAFMRSVDAVLGEPSANFWDVSMIAELFEGKSFEQCEWSLALPNGRLRHFVGSTYPFTGPNGKYIGAISANVDITDRVQAEKKIEEQVLQLADMNRKLELLSITDGLTGLRNHRYFQERLEESLKSLTTQGRPVSLILLDVDHFKKFNDTFGHVAGDRVLRDVASILRDTVDEPGLPARYGGEEFAVVLPGYTSDEAVRIAEALRRSIESHHWSERTVTASLGVATTTEPEVKSKELIELADSALYRSKAEGRNRTTFLPFGDQEVKAA